MANLMLIIGLEILGLFILLVLFDLFKNGKDGFTSKLFLAVGIALFAVLIFEIYNSLNLSHIVVIISSLALGVFFLILSVLVSR